MDEPTLTKHEAEYRDHPKGRQYCGLCKMFERPNHCSLVIGVISRIGWCRYWEKRGAFG